jgi:hypothetical protein
MSMKVCVALALLGTPCLTGVAANAQYYYPPYPGPVIVLGINGYAYRPPIYYQFTPQQLADSTFYRRYNQYAYPSYYGDCYGC